jgi:hypothetical protein
MVIHSGPHGARGVMVPCIIPGNLSIAMVLRTILVKPGIRPIVNLYKVYNCHNSRAYGYKWSGILSRLVVFRCGLVSFWFSLRGVV